MVAPLARTRQDLGGVDWCPCVEQRQRQRQRCEGEEGRRGGGAAARVHVQSTVHGRPRAGAARLQAAGGRRQTADGRRVARALVLAADKDSEKKQFKRPPANLSLWCSCT